MKEVDYVLCVAGNQFSGSFLGSWTNTIIMLEEKMQCRFLYSIKYNPIITGTRNQSVTNAHIHQETKTLTKPLNGEYKCKKFLFIDDDMVWSPADVEKVLLSDKDIIGATYTRGDRDGLTSKTNAVRDYAEAYKGKTEPVEVSHIGLGFLAVKHEVFERLEFPWFDVNYRINQEGKYELLGEDYYFTEKAQAAGYKIYVDPTLNVGHEKPIILGL